MKLNAYQIMWIFVFFDMPTETEADKKRYVKFRKKIMDDGFTMFQFSIYLRHCSSRENAEVHMKRVLSILPEAGHIGMISITDKQFGQMVIFDGKKEAPMPNIPQQLELF